MLILDQARHDLEQWRPGVRTRMRASAVSGMAQLCVFEQWCDAGTGAPTHLHAVEELLIVLDGQADVWLDAEQATLISAASMDSATAVPVSCTYRPSSLRRSSRPRSTIRAKFHAAGCRSLDRLLVFPQSGITKKQGKTGRRRSDHTFTTYTPIHVSAWDTYGTGGDARGVHGYCSAALPHDRREAH
jgi:mannose-6-phosphate isomerase-like protein (cupin superfamily)